MSFRDYLHEKAEESRHNETLAYLMFLAGAIFFVGGIVETLSLTGNPEWLLFVPYFTDAYPGVVLGLALIVSGFSLMIFGIIVGMSCSRDRGWYLKELRKASSIEQTMMDKKAASVQKKKKGNI